MITQGSRSDKLNEAIRILHAYYHEYPAAIAKHLIKNNIATKADLAHALQEYLGISRQASYTHISNWLKEG